jgi:hypothetical protein
LFLVSVKKRCKRLAGVPAVLYLFSHAPAHLAEAPFDGQLSFVWTSSDVDIFLLQLYLISCHLDLDGEKKVESLLLFVLAVVSLIFFW